MRAIWRTSARSFGLAPSTWAIMGETAEAGPKPSSQVKKKTVLPSVAAASAVLDSRPSMTMSVVMIAICASWVTISGKARRPSARASASQPASPSAVTGLVSTLGNGQIGEIGHDTGFSLLPGPGMRTRDFGTKKPSEALCGLGRGSFRTGLDSGQFLLASYGADSAATKGRRFLHAHEFRDAIHQVRPRRRSHPARPHAARGARLLPPAVNEVNAKRAHGRPFAWRRVSPRPHQRAAPAAIASMRASHLRRWAGAGIDHADERTANRTDSAQPQHRQFERAHRMGAEPPAEDRRRACPW